MVGVNDRWCPLFFYVIRIYKSLATVVSPLLVPLYAKAAKRKRNRSDEEAAHPSFFYFLFAHVRDCSKMCLIGYDAAYIPPQTILSCQKKLRLPSHEGPSTHLFANFRNIQQC